MSESTINFEKYDELNAKDAGGFLDVQEDAGVLAAYVEHERANKSRSTVLTDERLGRLPKTDDPGDGGADETPTGATASNGVFVPTDVEAGEVPGWPLYETDDDWLPLALSAEQREHLTEAFDGDEDVEPEYLIVEVDGIEWRVSVDSDGDYIANEVSGEKEQDVELDEDESADPDDRHWNAEMPITKENDVAWWCPFDDHSMIHGSSTCAKCGARREGDLAGR